MDVRLTRALTSFKDYWRYAYATLYCWKRRNDWLGFKEVFMQERKSVSTEPSDRGIERGATCTRPKSKFRGLFDRIVEHMTIARTLPIISRIKVIFVHIPPYGELVVCDFTTDFVYTKTNNFLVFFPSPPHPKVFRSIVKISTTRYQVTLRANLICLTQFLLLV